jgi:hypothetical protein
MANILSGLRGRRTEEIAQSAACRFRSKGPPSGDPSTGERPTRSARPSRALLQPRVPRSPRWLSHRPSIRATRLSRMGVTPCLADTPWRAASATAVAITDVDARRREFSSLDRRAEVATRTPPLADRLHARCSTSAISSTLFDARGNRQSRMAREERRKRIAAIAEHRQTLNVSSISNVRGRSRIAFAPADTNRGPGSPRTRSGRQTRRP